MRDTVSASSKPMFPKALRTSIALAAWSGLPEGPAGFTSRLESWMKKKPLVNQTEEEGRASRMLLTNKTDGSWTKRKLALAVNLTRHKVTLLLGWSQRNAEQSVCIVDSASTEAHGWATHGLDGSVSCENDQVSLRRQRWLNEIMIVSTTVVSTLSMQLTHERSDPNCSLIGSRRRRAMSRFALSGQFISGSKLRKFTVKFE